MNVYVAIAFDCHGKIEMVGVFSTYQKALDYIECYANYETWIEETEIQ